MKYKSVIFDLDGTLIDSLQGILDAVNLAFKQLGYNVKRNYEEAKYFIGAGAEQFALRAMQGQNIPFEAKEKVMQTFLVNYLKTQEEATLAFKGINELLTELKNNDVKVCIATNKPQIALEAIVKKLFPNIEFDALLGQRPNKPEKPDPFIIFEIMKKLGLKEDDCVYIGDSEYDYKTAHNAGIDFICVTYGYGFYNEPWMNKVKQVAKTIDELKEKVLI